MGVYSWLLATLTRPLCKVGHFIHCCALCRLYNSVTVISLLRRNIVAASSQYCRCFVAILSLLRRNKYCRCFVAILSLLRRNIVAASSQYCRCFVAILSLLRRNIVAASSQYCCCFVAILSLLRRNIVAASSRHVIFLSRWRMPRSAHRTDRTLWVIGLSRNTILKKNSRVGGFGSKLCSLICNYGATNYSN